MNQFVTWLDGELDKKSWNRAELAQRANISQASLSHIWKGDRNPGTDLCEAIARALNLPPEEVFRAAGLLPAVPPDDAQAESILHLVRGLTPEQRSQVEDFIRWLSQHATRIK